MVEFKAAPKQEQKTMTGMADSGLEVGQIPIWGIGAAGLILGLVVVVLVSRLFDGLTTRY
jgi:hypothetical protein